MSFPGRHPAILDKATFDAVQALMRDNSVRRRTFVSKAKKSLLYGLLFDADGGPMEFFVVTRQRRRYAY